MLKIAIALLAYNRLGLLRRTVASIETAGYPYTLHAVDNGSTDGSAEYVAALGGVCNRDGNHTVGHGMNLAIGQALAAGPDWVLFTADDYEYTPGWLARLVPFLSEAPDTLKLICLNLEPVYPWNRITGTVQAGGLRGLLRQSIPGSNWLLRTADWPLIGPLAETTGGEDLAVCRRLLEMQYDLAALDLCAHSGERCSAWGNQSWCLAAPLDKAAYGL